MSKSTHKTIDLSSFSILLAEDYDFIQQVTTGMLKRLGVSHITVSPGGNEAKGLLKVLTSSKSSGMKMPDIILTDWMMPEGSGEKLLKWIRGHDNDRIRFLPIIVVSAFTDRETIFAARDAGANEVLVKPVSGTKLANRILSVINHPRPYIKSPAFFGPDRRRREQPYDGSDKRVANAEEIKVNNEQI